VQADHLPTDKSVVDAYVVSHSREVAHRQEAGFFSLG
jgi:hypothetical protein